MARSRKQPKAKEVAVAQPRPMIVELNFLPDRYRGRGMRILTTLRPWLFLMGFALLLIPSAQLFQRTTVELARVEAELATVTGALEGYQPLADERALLEARVGMAQAQIVEFQAAYDIIDIRDVTWSEMVPLILAQVPGGVDLTLVSQSEEEVVLEGVAEAYRLPSILADNLRALGRFETVTIQTVVRVEQVTEPELAPVEAPADEPAPGEDEQAAFAGESPSFVVPAAAVSGLTADLPPLYGFKISIFLPLYLEPSTEPADAG